MGYKNKFSRLGESLVELMRCLSSRRREVPLEDIPALFCFAGGFRISGLTTQDPGNSGIQVIGSVDIAHFTVG